MNNTYSKGLLENYLKSGLIKIDDNYIIDENRIDRRDEWDSIYFGKSDYSANKNKVFLIVNKTKNKYCIAYPKESQSMKPNHTSFNKLLASIDEKNDQFDLYELSSSNVIRFNDVKRQLFKDLRDEIITVSSKYKYLFEIDSDFFVLKNDTKNCRIIVSKEHVKYSDALNDGSIRLNRKQRIALGILDSEVGYKFSKSVELVLFPYPKINNSKFLSFERLKDKILRVFVGRVNIGLVSKRTYQSDETFNIVRISSDVMKLLGISDTDIVKITYCYTSCYCRVLPISNNDKIIEQNNEIGSEDIFEMENIICIPANIRNELGIVSVKPNIMVKVERDMGYIFKKNFNKQILPIILILFSTEIFVNGRELIIKIIIALISLPITMYFNLSSERAICK